MTITTPLYWLATAGVASAAAAKLTLTRDEMLSFLATDGSRRQPQAPLPSYMALPKSTLHSDYFLGESLNNVVLWNQCALDANRRPSDVTLIHTVWPSWIEKHVFGQKVQTRRYVVSAEHFKPLLKAASKSRGEFSTELNRCLV